MMFLAAGLIGALALLAGALLGPKRGTTNKLAAYESGIPTESAARERFPVHFYLVAMIFIPFDIEVALLVPLAVRFNVEPQLLFWQALIFIGILSVGYLYILKRGVLNWK